MNTLDQSNLISIKPKILNHLRALAPLIFFMFIVGVGLSYGLISNRLDTDTILIISPILLIFVLPPIYFHLTYWIHDFNSEIILNKHENLIIYKRDKIKIQFEISEIESITYFGETKGFNNSTWQNYFFYQIQVRNSEKILITCLLTPHLELTIPKLQIKVRKIFADLTSNQEINK